MAFMVSSFDCVVPALPSERKWLEDLHRQLDKVDCSIHGLSSRAAKLFLYLPDHLGGIGVPWLGIWADLRYLPKCSECGWEGVV